MFKSMLFRQLLFRTRYYSKQFQAQGKMLSWSFHKTNFLPKSIVPKSKRRILVLFDARAAVLYWLIKLEATAEIKHGLRVL